MEILAIIPARGGSKGIPRKNLAKLCGQPLIYYTFKAVQESRYINRVIVSTDDHEIAQYAKNMNIEVPFIRPNIIAADETSMIEVVFHAIRWLQEQENYMPDIIVLLQPTSPLRKAIHIEEVVELLLNSKCDTVVSVTEVPHQYTPSSIMKIEDGLLRPFIATNFEFSRRQEKPKFYARNGPAVLAVTFKSLMENKAFYTNCVPYIMSSETSVDIDSELDLCVASEIIKNNSNS